MDGSGARVGQGCRVWRGCVELVGVGCWILSDRFVAIDIRSLPGICTNWSWVFGQDCVFCRYSQRFLSVLCTFEFCLWETLIGF